MDNNDRKFVFTFPWRLTDSKIVKGFIILLNIPPVILLMWLIGSGLVFMVRGNAGSEFVPVMIFLGLGAAGIYGLVVNLILLVGFWSVRSKSKMAIYLYFLFIFIVVAGGIYGVYKYQKDAATNNAEATITKVQALKKINECAIDNIAIHENKEIWIMSYAQGDEFGYRLQKAQASIESEYNELVDAVKSHPECGDITEDSQGIDILRK